MGPSQNLLKTRRFAIPKNTQYFRINFRNRVVPRDILSNRSTFGAQRLVPRDIFSKRSIKNTRCFRKRSCKIENTRCFRINFGCEAKKNVTTQPFAPQVLTIPSSGNVRYLSVLFGRFPNFGSGNSNCLLTKKRYIFVCGGSLDC